jgi:AcrR family transcriptional regulator
VEFLEEARTPPRREQPLSAQRRRRVKPADVRRDEILDATERVLLADGAQHLKVDVVAAHADIAVGTIYRYFGSKDDLIAAARVRYIERWTLVVTDVGEAAAIASRDKLRQVITRVFEFGARHAALHRVLFQQSGGSDLDTFSSLADAFSDLIADGVETGEFDVPDIAAATTYLVHGLHGLLVAGTHGGTTNDVVDTACTLADRTLVAHRD